MSYPNDLECPSCGAENKSGNNVEDLTGGEYFCHAFHNLWDDPLASDDD